MRSVLIFLIFLLAGLTGSAWAAKICMQPEQIAKMGVLVQPLGQVVAEGGAYLPAQVVIPPAQIDVLAAPLPALVAKVFVAHGETVKKGQTLAQFAGTAFHEAQREFAQAEAQAALAAENRRRDETLFADGIVSQARLSSAIAAERQAMAALTEKRAALRLAGLPEKADAPVAGVPLRAPFDGVVLEAVAQPGQRVDAQTPLFKLGRISPLWLEMQASVAQAAHLAPGDSVVVPSCAQPAKIALIAPHMQQASQSLLIRAVMAQPAGCIKPFQFVRIDVAAAKGGAAGFWRLPTAALARHQGRAWVFLAVEGGFDPVPVEVVDEAAGAVRLKAELPAGARIAVKGVAAIKAAWLGLGAGEE